MLADGAPAPPLDTWWEGFGDRELTRIVQRALDQNLDLAASVNARGAGACGGQRGRCETEAFWRAERAVDILPPVALKARLDVLRERCRALIEIKATLDLGVAASWEIDLFGGLRHGAQAACEEVQAAEAERLGTRVSIVAEAADAYMQYPRRSGASDLRKRADRHGRASASTGLPAYSRGGRFGPEQAQS